MAFDSSFDAKEQVRQAIDIVDLVGKYAPLRRQGRNFVARCPWHDDTRPSLQVNPERQSWKCWVCDVGGDIFSFFMKIEGVEFGEALRTLAEQAGIDLKPHANANQATRTADASPESDKRILFKAAAWVEEQFHECLLNAPEAEIARNYFRERHITDESIARFRLGFCPLDRDWIIQKAGGNAKRLKILEAIGVLSRSSSGGNAFNPFSGRGMFSIRNAQGKPVGFGGRQLPGIETFLKGKYVNSTETPLFHKSKLLYGLNLAKDGIRKTGLAPDPVTGRNIKTVLVMEGYTDVIVAHQFGFTNAVAALGTALNENHIRSLKPHADRIVLVLDGDEAGQKSANKVLELFVSAQADMQVLTLPDGLDPCEFLLERGAEAFAELLYSHPVNALDHAFQVATRGIDVDRDVYGATAALEKLLGVVASAPRLQADTPLEARLREEKFLQRLASLFRLDEAAIRKQLTALRRKLRDKGPSQSAPAQSLATSPQSTAEPLWNKNDTLDPTQRELMEMLVVHPEVWPAARPIISAEKISSLALRIIYQTGCRLFDSGTPPTFERMMLELDDVSLKSLLVDLDEQGQAKAQHRSEPEVLVGQLLAAFEQKEIDRRRPGQIAAARQKNLDDDQATAWLEAIVREKRRRQGMSEPTDG